jgi:hypothetical protein
VEDAPKPFASSSAGSIQPMLVRRSFGYPPYAVIQQQLIQARDHLDRQVTSLTRMHAFNARALGIDNDAEFAAAVGEALVEVFDLDFGVCWLCDSRRHPLRQPPGMLGLGA